MSKPKKCHYCKKVLSEEKDEIVEFEMGKKKIIKKYACKNCRNEKIYKDKFYEKLFSYLDIRVLDKNDKIYIIAENMQKKYSWEILLHALKEKEIPIRENALKGIRYALAIISNQMPFSESIIKKQFAIKAKKKQIQKLKEENEQKEEQVIIINKKPEINKPLINCEDIFNL